MAPPNESAGMTTVDAAAILDQVRSRIRQERLLPETRSAVRFHSGGVPWSAGASTSTAGDSFGELAFRLANLQARLDAEVQPAVRGIGAAPPTGLTTRGRLGAGAIRILQRLLWWHTGSLHRFGNTLCAHHQAELEILKSLAIAQEETRGEVAALRAEVERLRNARG